MSPRAPPSADLPEFRASHLPFSLTSPSFSATEDNFSLLQTQPPGSHVLRRRVLFGVTRFFLIHRHGTRAPRDTEYFTFALHKLPFRLLAGSRAVAYPYLAWLRADCGRRSGCGLLADNRTTSRLAENPFPPRGFWSGLCGPKTGQRLMVATAPVPYRPRHTEYSVTPLWRHADIKVTSQYCLRLFAGWARSPS